MLSEKAIIYERGDFWVREDRTSYTVFRSGITHSVSDSAYRKDADGLSIAKARCNYLASRYPQVHHGTTITDLEEIVSKCNI